MFWWCLLLGAFSTFCESCQECSWKIRDKQVPCSICLLLIFRNHVSKKLLIGTKLSNQNNRQWYFKQCILKCWAATSFCSVQQQLTLILSGSVANANKSVWAQLGGYDIAQGTSCYCSAWSSYFPLSPFYSQFTSRLGAHWRSVNVTEMWMNYLWKPCSLIKLLNQGVSFNSPRKLKWPSTSISVVLLRTNMTTSYAHWHQIYVWERMQSPLVWNRSCHIWCTSFEACCLQPFEPSYSTVTTVLEDLTLISG